MAALQNIDRVSFVVDTLASYNGRKLTTVRSDEEGYYKMPIAVLGTPTDNRTYYEVEDFVAQITSPESFVYKCLSDGKLFGEYGHPMIQLLPEDKQIMRLMLIDEKSVSHHIRSIETGDKLESGGRVLYGSIKPHGPYAESLKNSLDDPCLNTSFSLRSIAQSRVENGLTRRRIKHLVTFDYVNAGGYKEASKRYAPATESTVVDIALTGDRLRVTESAVEHLSETELNEIFGAKVVSIGNVRTTFIAAKNALQDADGNLRSVYTSLLGGAR